MGKVFIKTDVLGRPHWDIGGGLTSLKLAPALVICPMCPSVCPHAVPKTKKLSPPMLLMQLFHGCVSRPITSLRDYERCRGVTNNDSVGGVLATINITRTHSVSTGGQRDFENRRAIFYFCTYRLEILHTPSRRQYAQIWIPDF